MAPSGNLYLPGDIKFERETPFSHGGYGVLFVGFHEGDGKVALKRLHIAGTKEELEKCAHNTLTEARIWRTLVHANVLPFLGVLFEEGHEMYLVSPYLQDGALRQYVIDHPDANKATLLREVAEGLAYLHTQGVIHGDVKGANILVYSGPRAMLCDFGISKILSDSLKSTKGALGTTRWQSPELMRGGARSFEADVYAYGITLYEIISAKIPFYDYELDSAVIAAVLFYNKRPPFEDTSNDPYASLRDIAQRCWTKDPKARPSMVKVLDSLPPAPNPLQTLSTPTLAESIGQASTSTNDRAPESWFQRIFSNQKSTQAELVTLTGHAGDVLTVAFSPRGSQLASGSLDSTVRLWDVASGTLAKTFKGHMGTVWSVTFSPGGSRLASGSSDKTIRLWDAISGEESRTLRGHTDAVESIAFSPEGSRLVSGSNDGTVRVWDRESGAVLATLVGHTDGVWSVAFSPSGSQLASGSKDQTVRLWDVVSQTETRTIGSHSDKVSSVGFSADGSRLVSGSHDKTVRLWTPGSETQAMILKGHTNWVTSIAISPDGSKVASGSHDKTVRLWDLQSGVPVAILKGNIGKVSSVAFSPDGSCLALGSHDSKVRLWRME